MSNSDNWLDSVKARLKAATPGPWFVVEQPFDNRSTAVYGDNKAQVPCDPHGARFITDCDVTMEWTEGEPDQSVFDRANAKLIAHAPTDIDKAIRIIECYEEALKFYAEFAHWKTVTVEDTNQRFCIMQGSDLEYFKEPNQDSYCGKTARKALAEAEKIKGEGLSELA